MYDDIAPGYDELHRSEQESKLRIIAEHLDVQTDDRLLDVGCGTGFSKEFFDCRWKGIEPSKEMAAQGEDIIIGRAEALPLEDDDFDIVISVTAIHNFDDIEKGLLEMRRVGRRFAFSVLKRSKHFDKIEQLIQKHFFVDKVIHERLDTIFICGRQT